MNFELKAAKEKLEREQKQRKDQAKARLEREKKAKEEAARLREALETSQRLRRIQEAEAAEAARKQEENDLFAGDGIRFNVVLQAIPVYREGDKINLPPSAFEKLSSDGALDKGPMFFEISAGPSPSPKEQLVDAKRKITHCGVLQFTTAEGFAELPPHVWKNAGIPEESMVSGSSIKVRYVRLPKCTYAKLTSENADFSDVPNHRAVLETKLRQHATLSTGDVLLVQHDGVDYSLHVLELKPDCKVSVLDTDMEVDLVQSTSANSQGRLVPLEIGKSVAGCVNEGEYKYFKFNVDSKMIDSANSGNVDLNVHLEIDMKGTNSDADLYVSAHPVLFPTQHHHHWASHDLGSKVIHLAGAGKILTSNSYSIGVYGYQGNAEFKICVQSQPRQDVSGHKLGLSNIEGKDGAHLQDGFELCGNCKQVIPSRSIALHEAYCRRHNVVCKHPGCGVVLRNEELKKHTHCSKCGQSLQVEELEKHMKIYHEPQYCMCGVLLEREEMVNHRAISCPLRLITCRFCGDMVQAGTEAEDLRDKLRGLTQHESLCGSRTAPCEVCNRSIMLKEMELHKVAAHDTTPLDISAPAFSGAATSNDTSTFVHPPTNREQIQTMICPICSHAFQGLDAASHLNKHLDTEHLLENDLSAASGHIPTVEVPNSASSSAFRSSLSVSCPICGLAVHSERDLSLHMDMVH